MHGIELLQQNNIQPSIIMVLTQYALDYPDEIWQFFVAHRLTRLAFNVEEIDGVHKQSSLAADGTYTRYKRFFTRLLELQEQCENPPSVRELDRLINIMGYTDGYPERKTGAPENEPLAILSFDYEGNVSTFSPELLTMTHPDYGNFTFASVCDGTLEDMLSSRKFGDMHAKIRQSVSKCRESCRYFAFCGGGSPSNKLYENNAFDSTETMLCKLGRQAIVDAVLDYLESKYALPSTHNLSPLERIMRLRQRAKCGVADEVLSTPIEWPVFDSYDDWDKGGGR